MSRSYRKPWVKDSGSYSRYFKGYANRVIRRIPYYEFDIADGGSYRKHFDQYTICDFRFRHNPNPILYFNYRIGAWDWIEPDPIYKFNRK